jgi:hypothetical protein
MFNFTKANRWLLCQKNEEILKYGENEDITDTAMECAHSRRKK